jgi:SGNH hydrolase-like domain, acetyltransferase AlgX
VLAAQPTRTAGLAGVWDGSAQSAADAWFSARVAYRPLFIRAFNEALYRAFAASYMNNRTLVFGQKQTLFERLYIEAYCGLRHENDRVPPEEFARRLRAAQLWFTSRGQHLIYALAPSKPTWFPDRISSAFRCPADQRDRNYRAAIRALTAAGVTFVDGRAVLEAPRSRAVELFPRNGTHWNAFGAALFVEALTEAIRRDGMNVPPFRYEMSMEPVESGADDDLIDLANLLWRPAGAPAPAIHMLPPKIPGTLRMATVNDSFLYGPAWQLAAGKIVHQIDFYYYFSIFHRRYPEMIDSAVDPTHDEDMAPIFTADVVVLEEVEARWGGPLADRFLDLVDRMRIREAAR